MKKTYKQPQTEAAEIISQSIICVSGGYGGSSDNIGNGNQTINLD